MASYTVAVGEIGVYAKQLTANTVDTVTISRAHDPIEVWTDGTAAVYFTVDGSTPVVGANATYEVPAGSPAVRDCVQVPGAGASTVVKLISTGTPKYSVTAPGGY